jgi:hypothetical protein
MVMGESIVTYVGYACIAAAIALFWFGRPHRSGEPAQWLSGGGPVQVLFPVFLMALFVGGLVLVVGLGGTGSRPW